MSLLRRALWVGIVLATLPVVGCGDYEARMRDEQERVKRFDEENKHLEDALELKKLEDNKEVSTYEAFVRAPKGISRSPDTVPLSAGGPYRYARQKEGPFTDMHVALAPADKKDFRDTVNQALGAYFREGAVAEKTTRNPPDREPILFEGWKNPQTDYTLYFCQQAGTQFAIGFAPDKTKGGADKAKEFCLDTVSFGSDATKARNAWNRLSSLRRR